jgi:hypothetical protein
VVVEVRKTLSYFIFSELHKVVLMETRIITQQIIDKCKHLISAYQAGNDEGDYNPLIITGMETYDLNDVLKGGAVNALVDASLDALLGQELRVADDAYFFEKVVAPYWLTGARCYDEVADLLWAVVGMAADLAVLDIALNQFPPITKNTEVINVYSHCSYCRIRIPPERKEQQEGLCNNCYPQRDVLRKAGAL